MPEEIRNVEPLFAIPENFTRDYLNTTNSQSNIVSPMSAIDEVDDIEAHHPIYVLVFGDEEERAIWRTFSGFHNWISWAKLQIERGDESLVANFGIDIRILGFLEWDSNNELETMTGLGMIWKAKLRSISVQCTVGTAGQITWMQSSE